MCCGRKRKKEIDCPDNCQYLIDAKNQWIKKIQLSQSQIDFWRSHFDVINNINFTLLGLKRYKITNLQNSELKDAIENLIKTLETEERGIIYEYRSTNYRIQSIFDSIQDILNRHRHIAPTQKPSEPSTEPQLRKILLAEAIRCLKFVQGIIKYIITKKMPDYTYFDFITYFTNNQLLEQTQQKP